MHTINDLGLEQKPKRLSLITGVSQYSMKSYLVYNVAPQKEYFLKIINGLNQTPDVFLKYVKITTDLDLTFDIIKMVENWQNKTCTRLKALR